MQEKKHGISTRGVPRDRLATSGRAPCSRAVASYYAQQHWLVWVLAPAPQGASDRTRPLWPQVLALPPAGNT